jgi:hypothetical protein
VKNLAGSDLRSALLSGNPQSIGPVLLQMLDEAKANAADTNWALSSDSKLVKCLFSVFCILDWIGCSITADPFVYFFSVTESQILDSGRTDLVLFFKKIQMLKFEGEFNVDPVQISPNQVWNAFKHASIVLGITTENHHKLKDCYKIGDVLISRASVLKLVDLTRKLVGETYKK